MGYFTRNEGQTDLTAAQVARQCTASLSGLLTARGMTRSDLAKAMGVSPGRVSQILSGDANLTVKTLAAAAQALNADVQIVFTARPQPKENWVQDAQTASLVGGGNDLPAHH